MNRHEITNHRYRFAFGVDHMIGTFFQVWEIPNERNKMVAVAEDTELNEDDGTDSPQVFGSKQFGIKAFLVSWKETRD